MGDSEFKRRKKGSDSDKSKLMTLFLSSIYPRIFMGLLNPKNMSLGLGQE
jgi:hypothetical protein